MLEEPTAQEAQAQLLRRIAAGDVQALSDFYDQTATPLFSVATRILGDQSEAEEVIQDVFVQIWEKAPMFDPVLGSAFHWALRITRNRAIDRLRSRRRRSSVTDLLRESAAAEADLAASPDFTIAQTEEAATVRHALAAIPKDQRQVIELAFFSGLTHLEIAQALAEPLGTVKARIRRGLLKLRDTLQNCSS